MALAAMVMLPMAVLGHARRWIIHAAWSSTPLGHPCRSVIHAAWSFMDLCRMPAPTPLPHASAFAARQCIRLLRARH